MKATTLLSVFLSCSSVFGAGFRGKFLGVPEEAIDVRDFVQDNIILNGLNFQSRIDVKLYTIDDTEELEERDFAVKKSYEFDVEGLSAGEYELLLNSYDFNLRTNRYRVVVDSENIKVYEDYLASTTYNQSSLQVVDMEHPLIVDVLDSKEYYESHLGKLNEMLMNSPLGFIFKNRTYTLCFFACLSIMVGPYLISFLSPDLAEELTGMQKPEDKETQAPVEPPVESPVEKVVKNGGKNTRQRKV